MAHALLKTCTMTRYSIGAIPFAALMHSFSPHVACAESSVTERTAASTANQTQARSAAISPPSTSADTASTSSPPNRVWYGGPILGFDALAVALVMAGAASESGAVLVSSGLVYIAGGPVVHGTHHNGGKAVASLGLRVGLPFLGGLVGVHAGSSSRNGCSGEMCGLGGAVAGGALGVGVGMIAASAIDISLLAYESKPESVGPRVALLPAIDPNKRSASLTLQGNW